MAERRMFNKQITRSDAFLDMPRSTRLLYYDLSLDAIKEGYACGVYGWNWDAFEIQASNGEKVAICTGYRDMTGESIEGRTKFEEKAKAIYSNREIEYSKREKQAQKNLTKFADYCIEKIRAQRKG